MNEPDGDLTDLVLRTMAICIIALCVALFINYFIIRRVS